ncbi:MULTISPECIES: D-ribose pyranase [Ureibacillus]|uniref:D-ribose pyranase n=1 Tax=Ureibacillus thermosphaericus TaxID=51173 RepID=A0A840PSB5_URETH|nr:D-ribose pyranase [Ureibacillus thermosphaericus]MBB5149369.1 D-ribose pyranase [Ureibacillus thermosphaericus]NKZ32230.1 D-ribose pyranase [Ureibacillus thermosphaericus]
MKKHGILNRELAGRFAKLGHTDQIVIADCGLPIPDDVPCIDLSYKLGEPSFLTMLEVVLDDLVVESAVLAEEIKTKNAELSKTLTNTLPNISYVSHEEFKRLTKNAKFIIRTGETTPYANVILQCGVIF